MTAKSELLEQLAAALVDALRSRVTSEEATAADFNVVRQFLKDNGIQFGDPKSEPMQGLIRSLPFADGDHLDTPNFKN